MSVNYLILGPKINPQKIYLHVKFWSIFFLFIFCDPEKICPQMEKSSQNQTYHHHIFHHQNPSKIILRLKFEAEKHTKFWSFLSHIILPHTWPIQNLPRAYPGPIQGHPRPIQGLSMTYLWPIHDLSMAYLWPIYDISIAYLWPIYGLSRAYLWPIYSLSRAYPGPIYNLSKAYLWPI